MSWKLLKIPPVEGFQTSKETGDLYIPVSSLRHAGGHIFGAKGLPNCPKREGEL
jgi:hypothetical protein